MSQELVISSNPIETTVAILEDGRLVEICVEHHAHKALVGSIYKGRVTRVLPGMQSAFVNLGLQRDAFLYVTDVLDPSGDIDEDPDARQVEAVPAAAESAAGVAAPDPGSKSQNGPDPAPAAAKSRRSRRRRRRRRRSKRRSAGNGTEGGSAGPPEAKAASAKADDADGTGVAEPRPVEEEPRLTVLPGESIAKYSKSGRGRRRSRRTAKGRNAAPKSSRGAQAGPAPEARGEPADRARGETQSRSATDSGPPKDGARSESEPPRLAASVEPPPTVSELRVNAIGWLKRKLGSPEKTAPAPPSPEKPSPKPARRRRSRRRSSKPRSSQQAKPKPARPAAPGPAKGRPSKRSQRRRAKPPSRARGRRHSDRPGRSQQASPQANIGELLRPGQELVVQVNKEPVGAKGARITSHVSLPGRYMVFLTTATHNGVARTIQPESERARLRKIVDKHSEGKEGGFVVRTAGGGVSEDVLIADMEFLHQQWADLKAKAEKRKAPATLHSDLDIVERVLRDNLGQTYKSIWVDSEAVHQRILRFVKRHQPDLADRVKLYRKSKPIQESFGVKRDLEKALRPKVWLKSGGYIVIDQTEALVAIDVNTGRYVGKSNRLEDTVLKTNLEAAEEIIRQLRLRDLGGIIVIDFIDMEDRKNRQSVQQVLQAALKDSRSPTRLLPFNDFGLVVITRKAVRQSLERALCAPCPSCSGAGTVKSPVTVMAEIFAKADRIAVKRAGNRGGRAKKAGNSNGRGKDLMLRVHPDVAKSLKKGSSPYIAELEAIVGAKVSLRTDSSMHPEKFNLA